MNQNRCIVCDEPIEDGRTMCEDDRVEEIYKSYVPYGCGDMADR